MGDISNNFSRTEFSCKCGCGFSASDIELVETFEWLRSELALRLGRTVRIQITSGCRCIAHNRKVGGAEKSQHINGIAADFKCYFVDDGAQVSPDMVADILEQKFPNRFGIGRYINRTHLDVRKSAARWES